MWAVVIIDGICLKAASCFCGKAMRKVCHKLAHNPSLKNDKAAGSTTHTDVQLNTRTSHPHAGFLGIASSWQHAM